MSGSRRNARPVDGRRKPAGRVNPSEHASAAHDAATPARGLSANQLMTAEQLAERWQVPKQHVYRLTRNGSVPVVKLGRYFRYRIDAIEAWEEGQ